MSRFFIACAAVLLSACATKPPREPVRPAPEPEPVPVCASIAAVGDIMLGGSAEPYLDPDPGYAFAATQKLLSGADIAIGNLETALTERDNDWIDKQYRFRNPPAVADALVTAGFDLVSLANNHSMDFGPAGLEDTLAALKRAGVHAHGAGADLAAAREPVIIALPNGLTIAFLAYSNTFPKAFWATPDSPGTAFGRREHLVADVKAARQRADRVVVSFHWGREKMKTLRGYQPMLAHAAIDAGASLVLGHHPHILQGVERYNDGLVLYSLGNFAFGSFSPSAKTSALAQVRLCRQGRVAFRLLPLNVNNFQVYFQPRVMDGAAGRSVLRELQELSEPLGMRLEWRDGAIVEATGEAPDHQ